MSTANDNNNNKPTIEPSGNQVPKINPHANMNPESNNQQQQQLKIPEQEINLNDIVMDLNTISKLCSQKVVDYSDISAVFKQVGQITNNLALGLSTYLHKRGELDESRFKLTPN